MKRKSFKFLFLFLLLFIFLESNENEKQITLTLEEYLNKVINNYNKIKISKLSTLIKEALIEEHKAINYGSRFKLGADQTTTEITGKPTLGMNLSWMIDFISGTKFDVKLNQSKSETTVLSGKDAKGNPQTKTVDMWNSTLSTTVKQSLVLNNYFHNKLKLEPKILNFEKQKIEYNKLLASIILEAITTYWKYKINKEQYDISKKALEDSVKLLDFNKRKQRIGTAKKTDIEINEILLIRSKDDLRNALENIQKLKDSIAYLIGIEIDNNDIDFIFKDELISNKIDLDKEKIYRTAFNKRDDWQLANMDLIIAKNAYKIALYNLWPSFDVFATYSLFGKDEEYGKTFSKMEFKPESSELKIGATFSFSTSVSFYTLVDKRPVYAIESANINLNDLNQSIKKELNKKILEVSSAYESLNSSSKVLKLRESIYFSGRKDYFNGIINSSRNVENKNNLRLASKNYLQNKLKYQQVILALELAEGILLEKYNININN